MNVALLQLDFRVGDVEANADRIRRGYERSLRMGAEMVVATELALLGYPPRDLLLRRDVLRHQLDALEGLARISRDVPLVVGFAEPNASGQGKPLFNALAVLRGGEIVDVRRKTLLPTYDVFDEHRYFEGWIEPQSVVEIGGRRVAFLICEDIWGGVEDPDHPRIASHDPVAWVAASNPDMLVVINGSPYWWGKGDLRHERVANTARRVNAPVVFANQVGGNDELIFDGRSFATDADGRLIGIAREFAEDDLLIDTDQTGRLSRSRDTDSLAQVEQALVLGLRDYVVKAAAFPGGALVGISGGLDSAVVARLAVAALGADTITGVTMPSPFSSGAGIRDAHSVAAALGIRLREIPITNPYESFAGCLRPQIGWCDPPSVTEENIQSRIRATVLMAIANRENRIVLGTGNKSELAMGYCTLYGDMAAGLGVISDVPKTLVRRLAHHMNRAEQLTPPRVLSKPPSAELRPGQRDTDTLPDYSVLDPVLEAYIDHDMGPDQLVAVGFDRALVSRVICAVERAEFKRRQMAPGLKVTTTAFGTGRRLPIAAHPSTGEWT